MQVRNLSYHFNGVQALQNVNLELRRGEVMGLIGPNGSGKSTLVNVLTGVLGAGKIGGANFSRTYQDGKLWKNLTVQENLLLSIRQEVWCKCIFSNLNIKKYQHDLVKVREVLCKLNILEYRNTNASELSYGQKKLVEIGRAIIKESVEILYLDEPFAGLSEQSIKLVSEIIRSEKESGKKILIIEHDMGIIENLCDYVYVLDAGKLICDGKPKFCLENEKVVQAYLGI